MSDEEIKTFITTFKSFMQHADVEEMNYLRRESTRKYKQLYYQSQARNIMFLMITTYTNLLKETK